MSKVKKLKAEEMDEITITPVNKDNVAFFAPMLPIEIAEELDSGAAALGAVVDGVAVGVIVVRADREQSVAELLWIYVAPDFRRQYIGSTLFCEMADILEDPYSFDFEGVSCTYSIPNDEVEMFLKSIKFEQWESDNSMGQCVEITLGEIVECDFYKKSVRNPEISYRFVAELTDYHMNMLNSDLDRNDANYTGAPVTWETVVPECSVVMYRENKPVGCLCVSDGIPGGEDNEKFLSVLFIYEKSTAAILGMFRHAGEAALKKFSVETLLKIPVVSDSSMKMVKRLFGERAKVCQRMVTAGFSFRGTEITGEVA
ncbi:MAG: GNAT family N-acetyltransferase [Oscillospiraceae bacterium]|nr:GNAT family N-acetyltransferase [Oscillospiraceae bacterium]